MTEEAFTLLFRFLVEYSPPDSHAARLIWNRIALLLFADGKTDEKGT